MRYSQRTADIGDITAGIEPCVFTIDEVIGGKYRITSPRRPEGIFSIYYAADETSGAAVSIIALTPPLASRRAEDAIRFSNSVEVLRGIAHPNILGILDYGIFGEIPFIAVAPLLGESLTAYLTAERPTMGQSIEFARQMASALTSLHGAGLLCRGVLPSGLFIARDGARLSLMLGGVPFSHMIDLNEVPAEHVADVFGYLPPEIIGMLKRGIDERSDLYSLGVILYQIFTGRLPFEAGEMSALIHQHIAMVPESPSAIVHGIPENIGRIVLRLMEKDPTLRYQTADGLLADIDRFLRGERNYILGERDVSARLTFQTSLIGRDEEMRVLEGLFERAQQGNGAICFIAGEAGRGKTRLAQELKSRVYSRGGSFISGKCFSGKEKTPYGPFREALDLYGRNFMKYPAGRKERIREIVRSRLGHLGQVALALSPALHDIIGEVEPLPALEPGRENERFINVASSLLSAIGESDSGLVIQIDDCQWADEGTITLIREMARDAARHHILLLGTYRDNEIAPDHPLHGILAAEEDDSSRVISLDIFDRARMGTFVAGLLLSDEGATSLIADFVQDKSRGNPFFAIEILKQLVEEGTIRRVESRWVIDDPRLAETEISSSIIDIIIRRINTLDPLERTVISIGAIIGNPFTIDLLFSVAGISNDDIVRMVDRGKAMQFIEEDARGYGSILFVHDRIKEAFYGSMDPAQRREMHLKVAKALEERYRRGDAEVIYELAYHYNEGDDPGNSLNYSYPAALKAREGYAYAVAIRYFRRTVELLESSGWKGNGLWLECMEQIGELLNITNRSDEAIDTLTLILPLVKEPLKKADLYRMISDAYYRKGDWEHTEDFAARGLSLLGETLPRSKGAVTLGIMKELAIRAAHVALPFLLVRSRPNPDSGKYRIIGLYYQLLNWSYALNNAVKFTRTVLRRLNLSERHIGPSGDLSMSHTDMGGLYMALTMYGRSAAHTAKGLAMAGEIGDERAAAESLEIEGYRHEWMGRYAAAREVLGRGLEIRERIGDLYEVGMILNGIVHAHYYEGDYDNAARVNDRYYEIASRAKDYYCLTAADIYYSQIYRERGDLSRADFHARRAHETSREKGILFNHCSSLVELGCNALDHNDFTAAIEHLEQARALFEHNKFLVQYISPVYAALAKARIDDFRSRMNRLTPREKKRIMKQIRRDCAMAVARTRRLPTHQGGALRVSAEYLTLAGRGVRAARLFEKSIESCRQFKRRFELAKSCYEFGLYLQMTGQWDAHSRLETAMRVFQEIGAAGYLRLAAAALGIEITDLAARRLMDRQRLRSVIDVSHDISSTLDPDVLLDLIMKKAVEVTGAQRGYLFLAGDNETLEMKASQNVLGSDWGGYSRELVDHVFSQKSGMMAQDAENERSFSRFRDVRDYRLKSILCIPIMHHERITGVCYLDNPIAPGVFSDEDLDVLQSLMTQSAISLENALLVRNLESRVLERTRELQKARDALWAEINVAQEIQTVLLPDQPAVPGYDVAAWMMPAELVGGDYYDVINASEGADWIVIGDVSGHGVPSGMVMLMVQTAVRNELYRNPHIRPRALLDNINRTISYNLARLEAKDPRRLRKYMTIIALSLQGGEITFSGQHEHILLYRPRTNRVKALDTDGIWLGFDWNHVRNVKDFRISLEPGDTALLYTDGIIDATGPDDAMLGIEGLAEIFHSLAPLPVREIRSGLIERLKKYTTRDDMAFVVFKRKRPGM